MPLFAMAQQQELIEKYSSIEGCATIELSKAMIASMGGGDGIDTLLAISVEREELIGNFSNEVQAYAKNMEKTMNVVQGSKRVTVY